MASYIKIKKTLIANPKIWLITGVAGFIGSNLLETLLKLDQKVVGLDNFSTGNAKNLKEVQGLVLKKQWANFKFIKGNISNLKTCQLACEGIDYVLHQAAIGSVPRSIKDPIYGAFINGDNVRKVLFPENLHLVMGNESNGITKEVSAFITNKIKVKNIGEKAESLNVAIAASVLLYEICN